jgi:hypothetical protein
MRLPKRRAGGGSAGFCCAKPSEVSAGLAGEMQGRRRERAVRSGQGRHLDPTDAAPRRIVPCLAPRKTGLLDMQRPKASALACERAATAVSRVGRRRQPAKLDRRRLQWVDASGICRGASRGRRGREAEGGGLLNRYRVVKLYRGFESLRLRHSHHINQLLSANSVARSARQSTNRTAGSRS